MPTASKLVAALAFAALGWFCADLIKPLLREGAQVGKFSLVTAIFGILVGWRFVGARIGSGQGNHFGVGVTGSALLVFWVTLAFATFEMYRMSIRKTYDGPVDAVQSMFGIAIEYLQLIAVPQVIAALILGGLLAGWLTRWTAQRWP